MTEENEFKVLDAKIAETQKLADEAQQWANRLGQLMNDLQVLKRARDLLLGSQPAEGQQAYVPVVDYTAQANTNPQPGFADAHNAQQPQLSIGALVVSILTEAARTGGRHANVPVKTILERVHAKGRTEVTPKTLGGVISQYLAKGAIRRTSRATYALPRTATASQPTANGASMHSD